MVAGGVPCSDGRRSQVSASNDIGAEIVVVGQDVKRDVFGRPLGGVTKRGRDRQAYDGVAVPFERSDVLVELSCATDLRSARSASTSFALELWRMWRFLLPVASLSVSDSRPRSVRWHSWQALIE